jgi:hypothetical protein
MGEISTLDTGVGVRSEGLSKYRESIAGEELRRKEMTY